MESKEIDIKVEDTVADVRGLDSNTPLIKNAAERSISGRRRGTGSRRRLKLNTRGRVIFAGIGIVLIIIVLALTGIFGAGAATAVNNHINVLHNPDIQNTEKLYPEEFWIRTLEAFKDSVIEINNMQELKQYFAEDFELEKGRIAALYGDDFRISYKTKSNKDAEANVFDSTKRFMNSMYGIDKDDIEDIKRIDLELIVKGSKQQKTFDITVYSASIGGNWYLITKSGALDGFSQEIN